MASLLLEGELLAACSALGFSDGVKYHKDAECLETVKDILRYLRKDDDTHSIRLALGQNNVLKTDLLPIIKFYSHDQELFSLTLRLIASMTTPIILLFNEELPEDKYTRQEYHMMGTHLQSYKSAFTDVEIWTVLLSQLVTILKQKPEDREDEEKLIAERILILTRNVLSVAAGSEDDQRTDDDASIHDRVIWVMKEANFLDVFMYIASSETEQEYFMHALEIIYLMLRDQDATQLAQAGLKKSESEKEKDARDLMEIRKQEEMKKKQKFQSQLNMRHSRFGGTYYIKNMKSISDKDLICHKQIKDVNAVNFDRSKKPKKVRSDKNPLKDINVTRRSTLAIRLFLKELCSEFLHGAYNTLMYTTKYNLQRNNTREHDYEHDESYYLWAIKFFLEFNRADGFNIKFVSETVNAEAFHFIQNEHQKYYDLMITDKKKIPILARRMQKALGAYKELLLTLQCMEKNSSESVRGAAKVIKSKIFYVPEYREMLLFCLKVFNDQKMTPTYLRDLVESTHVFLKIMESSGKQKRLIIQNKNKVRKKKKSKAKKPVESRILSEDELLAKWNSESESIAAILRNEQEETLPETNPFDQVSEDSSEVQKERAMTKINTLLRRSEFPEAVSLLRSSREIWPEGDHFGPQEIDTEGELNCLQLIYLANIGEPEIVVAVEESQDKSSSEDEEMEAQMPVRQSEQELNFSEYVRRFGHPNIIKTYGSLFRNFFMNSETINHCILKMFHRLAWDNKLVGIFFQASIFKTFQMLMKEPKGISKQVADAVQFAKYVMRRFFELAESNDKLFIEILFWKNKDEALEIECGDYGIFTNAPGGSKQKRTFWSEEEEYELEKLFEESKTLESSEKDVCDFILENLINNDRSRQGVLKKMKEMGLISDVKQLSRKAIKTKSLNQWSEVEELELKQLVSRYIGVTNPMQMIIDLMTRKRTKFRVEAKILEMGLVADKSALKRKKIIRPTPAAKRAPKYKKPIRARSDDDESREDNSLSSASEDVDYQPTKREHFKIKKRIKNKRQRTSKNPHSSDESEVEALSSDTGAPSPVKVTPEMIQSTLARVAEERHGALEWIRELLQETADDREEEGDFVNIPLLAMRTECSEALEDDQFQTMLKYIGINPPASDQEMFWRIPSALSVEALKKRAHYISQALEGKLEDSSHFVTELELNQEDKQSSKKKTKKRKKRTKRIENKENERNSSSNEDELSVSRSGPMRISDEDSSSDEPLSILKEKYNLPQANKSKRALLTDSSSEDEDIYNISSKTQNKAFDSLLQSTKMLPSDSEEDASLGREKSSKLSLTDDEEQSSPLKSQEKSSKRSLTDDEEQSVPLKSQESKKRRVILDEDSDNESSSHPNSPKVSSQNSKIPSPQEEEKMSANSSPVKSFSTRFEDSDESDGEQILVQSKKKSKLVISDDSD